MKKNLPVTDKQHLFDDSTRIVSTTDLKGAITYANKDFITVSGFSEAEIINKNHNLVRHPDMPLRRLKIYGITSSRENHGWELSRIAVKTATTTGSTLS